MCFKKWFGLICLILVIDLLFSHTVYALPEIDGTSPSTRVYASNTVPPEIIGSAAILYEPVRGQILYEKNINNKLHISTASKIMTAILAIEQAKMDAQVTISKEASVSEGSSLILEAGEKFYVEDLVYAVLLTSANDVAIALAEHVGGTVEMFVDLMNKKATELNMKDTYFRNPTGLMDEHQYTTAYDLSLLIRYCLNNSPAFSNMFSARARPWNGKEDTKVLINSNKLIWSYDGANGGKTGFNAPEQRTAITTASRSGFKLVSIVLDSPGDKVYDDTIKLLDYGFDNFKSGVLVFKDRPLKSIFVSDSEINLVSKNDVHYTHPIGENYIKSIEYNLDKNITPPVTKDRILGTARYTLNDNTTIDINLYSDAELLPPITRESVIMKRIAENKDLLILVVFLLALECILVIYHLLRLVRRLVLKIKG